VSGGKVKKRAVDVAGEKGEEERGKRPKWG